MLIKRALPFGLTGRRVAFDTEATGLNGWGSYREVTYNFGNKKAPQKDVVRRIVPARPFLYSFCDEEGNTASVRGKVDPVTRAVTWKRSDHDKVRSILEDPAIEKIGHNPRFDLLMAQFDGIQVQGKITDTMIVAHTYTAGGELTYALKPLAKKHLRITEDDEKKLKKSTHRARLLAKKMRWSYGTEVVGGRDPVKADYWMADEDLCNEYAIWDAIRSMVFWQKWMPAIQKDKRMREVCAREHEVFWVLKRMEDHGTRVHRPVVRKLKDFYEDYKSKQVKIADREGAAGKNYNSTPQMAKMFYEDRGHVPNHTETVNKKTGLRNYSLNGEHLLKMATGYVVQRNDVPDALWRKRKKYGYKKIYSTDDSGVRRCVALKRPPDPLAKAVLEYKAADQTISSFLEVYERYWVREDKGVYVLHTNYRQTGTVTGRLSCSDPNLMQVASATTGRRKADIQSRPREAFGPRPGYVWYLPDYSQIEVWLFAFMSGEKKMQASLLAGIDFHGDIARRVFGNRKDFKEHAEYYRKCAKLIMFCKLYGGGPKKMAALLKTSMEAAIEFIEQYETELPGVKRFMDKMINLATAEGEIYNAYGRRYEFEPDWAYRAVNYLIQGSAADVMKNALVNVDRMLRTKWADGPRLLLTIHDEIVVEVPEELHCVRLMKDVIRAMQMDTKLLGLPKPLPVEMKLVRTHEYWHEAKKIKFMDKVAA
jgi:DNA polymerase I-like protein with 3'-5' exonuclease and polymerase domains